jgi:phosphomannomutase/phosphoglucomutase
MIKAIQFFTMARLFIFLATISVLMILITGAGIFVMSKIWIEETREESATAVAEAVASKLSAQIGLLNQILNKIELDKQVIDALKSSDPVLLGTVATNLERCFPDVLKIRLFAPGVTPTDDQIVPKMGFADIEMVRESFNVKQLPSIQGDKGPDRHLALAGRVIEDGKVIGVILVSLKYDFIEKSIRNAAAKNEFIELKQGALVLSVSGDRIESARPELVQVVVPDTDWTIFYYYVAKSNPIDIILILMLMLVPALITVLTFISIHRKLSSLLAQDVNCVIKAVKDLMATQKLHSAYPVHLTEMNGVISTLVQFKRVLDSEKGREKEKEKENIEDKNPISGYDDLELDNFFDD